LDIPWRVYPDRKRSFSFSVPLGRDDLEPRGPDQDRELGLHSGILARFRAKIAWRPTSSVHTRKWRGPPIFAGKRIRQLNFGKKDDPVPPILRQGLRDARAVAGQAGLKVRIRLK
jgi:hypothetical protein